MKTNDKQTEDVKEMVSRVLEERQNWSKHLAHTCCKCEKCICGKHKCKIQPAKMDLKPSKTTYNDSYQQKKKYTNDLSEAKVQFATYHPKQFIKKSQYKQEYYRKNAKPSSAKPEKHTDNICLGGPNFSSTTYQQSYPPKINSKTSLIKNPQNLCNFGMKMNTNSHYRQNYNSSKNNPKTNTISAPIKHKDNLKTDVGISFTGNSCYMHDFTTIKPSKKDAGNCDSFAPKNQYISSHGLRPKSSYKCDYTEKRIVRCPAETCC